jgi:hypothetical protein
LHYREEWWWRNAEHEEGSIEVIYVQYLVSMVLEHFFLYLGHFFSFLILYTVGRTPWMVDQLVAGHLPAIRTAQTQNKRTQTTMPQVGFETTIPLFELGKTIHALDLAASVIGIQLCIQ